MDRKEKVFEVENISHLKENLLFLSKSKENVILLDSNSKKNDYEFIFSYGKISELKSSDNSLEKLDNYINQVNDWIFGFISYDLKDESILHWLGEGAQPTDAAKKLLRRAGLSHRWHLMQQGMDGSDLEKEMKKWELNREDVLKKRAEKQEQKAKVVAKKNEVEAVETVKNDSGDASSNDEGPNEDQLGENIPEQPEGSDKNESSQEEE